jgi:hypothetical protein
VYWGRREMHIGYRWESLKERAYWEDQGVDEWTLLERWDGMAWIELIRLRIGTRGWLLRTR